MARGKQTLQPSRERAPPAVQGNFGSNSKEIQVTITHRAEGSSKRVYNFEKMNVNHIMQKLHATGFATHQSLQSSLPVAGKLRHFVGNWQVLTADQWVLNTVQGFLIPFREEPRQVQTPHPYQYPADQLVQLREELAILVSKGAIIPLEPTTPVAGFYSTVFLVPKKEGRWRPVINLKALNSWVQPQQFKMEGIHTLRELLVRNNWLAKLDLKDAYFTVLIHWDHQKYLRFVVGQVHYQFTCLSFGLSCAPWAFTKVLRPVAAFLRTLGVRMIVYIDDMLIMGESPDVVRDYVTAMVALLEGLGFIVNTDKSMLSPTQQLEFLGMQVSSVDLHLHLPREKIKQIRVEPSQLRQALTAASSRDMHCSQVSTVHREVECCSTSSISCPAFLPPPTERPIADPVSERAGLQFLSPAFSGSSRGHTVVAATSLPMEQQIVDSASRADGDPLGCFLSWMGSSMREDPHRRTMVSIGTRDAHQLFGAEGGNSGLIALSQRSDGDIGITAAGQPDCSIVHQPPGGTVSPQLTDLAKNLWLWSLCRDLVLTAQHIPGVDNQIADSDTRELKDHLDLKLSPAVFRTINAI